MKTNEEVKLEIEKLINDGEKIPNLIEGKSCIYRLYDSISRLVYKGN